MTDHGHSAPATAEGSEFDPVPLGHDHGIDYDNGEGTSTSLGGDGDPAFQENMTPWYLFFFHALALSRRPPARPRNAPEDSEDSMEGGGVELPVFADTDSTLRHRKTGPASAAEGNTDGSDRRPASKKHKKGHAFPLKIRLVLLLERTRLFPEHWFHKQVESGTDNPLIVDRLTAAFRMFWKSCVLGLVVTVAIMYALACALYEPPTLDEVHVPEANLTVHNVYSADFAQIIDLSDNHVRQWLQENGPFDAPMQEQAFKDQYFSVPIYDPSSPGGHFVRNITFSVLETGMRRACTPDSCLCISAVHLGVPANLIMLNMNDTAQLLIEPQVRVHSSKRLNVTISHINGTTQQYEAPALLRVEYRGMNGLRHRETLINSASACVHRCVQIVTDLLSGEVVESENETATKRDVSS